jgi:uncharacterized protein
MSQPVLSPCVGICAIDEHGYCEGCLRTPEEIGDWLSYSPAQRERLMDEILPLRERPR